MAEPIFTPAKAKCSEALELNFGSGLPPGNKSHTIAFGCDLEASHEGMHECRFDNPHDWRSTTEVPIGKRAAVVVQWDSLPPKPAVDTTEGA